MCSTDYATICVRFPGGKIMNLLFNYFEGFNEGIIGRESEMRDFMVK